MEVSDLIQAYSKDPINNYKMEDFTVSYEQENGVCGDFILVYLRLGEGVIEEYSYMGLPSVYTLAAAGLLAEEIEGKMIDEVMTWNYTTMENLGFIVSPRRQRSAVSALLAVRNALHERKGDGIVDAYDDLL